MEISKEIGIIIGRSILTILTLFFVTKILGKKQLSQLTIYDYIVGITIGSIAADAIITLEEKLLYGLIAILVLGIFGYSLSYLAIKSTTISNLLNGKSTILIKNGIINFKNLKKTKITIAKLLEESRLKGYYDLSIIDCAILETNGQISFLPKEEYQNSNTKDFKMEIKSQTSKQTMCIPIIVDGKVNLDVLRECGKDREWLKKELKKKKITEQDRIILATIDEKQNLKIYKELV